MHLRYALTGEMTPWIDKLATHLTDPLHNEDPEPYSKRYSMGGTELTHNNLEEKLTKREKHNATNMLLCIRHNSQETTGLNQLPYRYVLVAGYNK